MNCEQYENFKPKGLSKGTCVTCKHSRVNNRIAFACLLDCNDYFRWEPAELKEVKECLTRKHSIHYNSTKTWCKVADDCNRGDRRFFLWEPVEPKEEKVKRECKTCQYNGLLMCGTCNVSNYKWEPVESKEEKVKRECETCQYNGLLMCGTCNVSNDKWESLKSKKVRDCFTCKHGWKYNPTGDVCLLDCKHASLWEPVESKEENKECIKEAISEFEKVIKQFEGRTVVKIEVIEKKQMIIDFTDGPKLKVKAVEGWLSIVILF